MLAWAALTSDDLPMPRAPHSSALLAGYTVGEAFGVFDQDVAHAVDALEQAEIDAVDMRHRRQPPIGVPDEGVRVSHRIGARGLGEPTDRPAAMASSARAILSSMS